VSHVVGLDIGGTQVRCALVNEIGESINLQRDKTQKENPGVLLSQILRMIEKCCQGVEKPKAIGVSIPGIVNSRTGDCGPVFNVPALEEFSLADSLSSRLRIPVVVDNDANAAAQAAYQFQVNTKAANLAYVTVSTSIGAGLILNGEVYHGKSGYAGELGHISIGTGLEICYECQTNFDCVTTFSSGTGLAYRALQRRKSGLLPRESQLNCENIDSRIVCRAALDGDPDALEILQIGARSLGRTTANLFHLLNLERVIFGGSVVQNCGLYWEMVKQEYETALIPAFKNDSNIELTRMGDEICLLGAAALAMRI
jgi:glucokinase